MTKSGRGGEDISIHAPRVGSDLLKDADEVESYLFQSTLHAWGATAR